VSERKIQIVDKHERAGTINFSVNGLDSKIVGNCWQLLAKETQKA
jgi:hypothetical protein